MNAIVEISAAQALVDQLIANGVDHIFCVPGESYLAVLDACYERNVKLTVCRNEAGAAMMADAYGKATGRPGICFVTRGPGAANAFAGVHIAQHDSTPMILFIGQIERSNRDRGAFQEVDYRAMFAGQTKWTAEIDDGARVTEYVSRAFHVALAGRPGPVALALPKDMLEERVLPRPCPPAAAVETAPGAEAMDALATMIAEAKRPLFVLGGTRWDETASRRMMDWASAFDMPVATSYRRLPLFDPLHDCYAGDLGLAANPKLVARARASDLFVLVGGRLGEIPSQGYKLLDIPAPRTRFVHIYPQGEEFGRVYAPTLAIHASPKAFIEMLAKQEPPAVRPWREETRQAHQDYLGFSRSFAPSADVDLAQTMIWLSDHLPSDAVICNGAGNYASWIHRYFRFRSYNSHFAPTSATMGYGVPAAVAIKRLYPERLVVSLNGDGDFLMNGQEFATAVQYDLPIIVVVCDNASYGTIRMHQERNYPARVVGTDLRNPDFAAYARAFGGYGARVERTQDFPEAFEAARASGLPSIIHLMMDPDRITPTANLSALRAEAFSRQ
ncbi:thiamine pyrophosphate-binding protein [Methylocystis sp. MJC1]|jgi:acetolactate synthase-1/2/3 large subunit|uniref:thiamine pyrophosphate-binding protein n=1 Tax=Methylocystis sp. MJC1 TaxID=2654282 RepID=UPI0013ECE8E2|nr:thiamine pyrophosphate-binding protein [Methylocystis sp. MJC1]KAF2992679.1 Acetolactate synthase isozyme 2 large subunit [Methylocystis sp. MJC1]MBU6526644.1 thiamine pyrophosphate-binding protein [Methylocystis sp. MJC1]UZX13086.1 thiamine pyrophosphate-binding protein [Methylocystis sp. MJC1]